MFLVTACVYLIGAIVLIIFAEAKTQPFALPKTDNKEIVNNDTIIKDPVAFIKQ